MQKITKSVDALGFDKWQIADIRRAYQSNKPTYVKIAKLKEKIAGLGLLFNQYKAELEAWEGPVKLITQKVLGMEITSEEVMAFHASPEAFYEKYPDHPLSVAHREAQGNTPLEEATEAPEETPLEENPVNDEPVF